MYVNVSSVPRRLFSAAVCLLAAGLYIAAVARHYTASNLEASADPKSLQRAAELESLNAETQWKLGQYALFVSHKPTDAVSALEAAVSLNPHVARYWLDLAASYQVTGDSGRQGSALEYALRAEPTSPAVAWEAANFYLVRNDLKQALPLFRVVMATDPKRIDSAVKLCWHATQDVDIMLADAVPAE